MDGRKTYLVFTVQGYQIQTPDGSLLDSVTIKLIETDADKALERAKGLVQKKEYRIAEVTEFYEKE